MEFGRRLVNHKPVRINLDIKRTHFILIDLVGVVDAITSSNMFSQHFRGALRLIHFNFNDLQVMTGKMLLQFVIESHDFTVFQRAKNSLDISYKISQGARKITNQSNCLLQRDAYD